MWRRALEDGNVWLAAGLFCLALFLALGQWAGDSAGTAIAQGVFIGLALVAFGAAVALLVRRQGDTAPRTARKPPAKKPRR